MEPDSSRWGPEARPYAPTFAALRHRDFRLFWLGLVLSLLGGWMQQFAGPLLVYRLTDSAFVLGLVGFIPVIAAAPLSLLAGPLVDRLPSRPLLIMTQLALFLPPIGLAVLVWTDQVQVWHVILAELLRGAVLALDQPAKQAAIVHMTSKEEVTSAIALWSSAASVTRVVGPVVAGFVAASAGVGLCFLLNGVSYLTVAAALLVIRLPRRTAKRHGTTLAGSLAEGLRYLGKQGQLIAVISLALLAALLIRPFQTLLPVFALDILDSGEIGLGYLTAAAGLGAVFGALGAASQPRSAQRRVVVASSLVLPFVTAAFAASPGFLVACVCLALLGGWEAAIETAANALVLTEVEDEFRGRAVSLYSAAAMGAPRVGGLQAGWLATRWNAPLALSIGAAAYLALGGPLLMVWRAWARRSRD